MTPTTRRVSPLELKSLDADGDGTFTGYGSVFHLKDSYGDVVMPGAFRRTLAESATKGRLPAMLLQHDPERPIGVWDALSEDDNGLMVKGRIAINTRDGRDAYEFLKMGAMSGLSIGYRTKKSLWDEASKTRQLVDLDLHEVSPVVFPANEAARVSAVKAEGPTLREVEDALRDAGLSRTQAKAVLADGWKALRDAALDDDEDALARMLRGYAKELRA